MHLHAKIETKTQELKSNLIALRRAIHQHPEIGLDLPHTASLITQILADEGIPFQKGVGKSGIVALIEGAEPGPCLMVRADMDALPITEPTGLEYASQIKGSMHACGHDLHAAALVGVAKVLWSLRSELKGTFKLVFQPGEEGLKGAKAMVADGLLENPAPDMALGFHNWPSLNVGQIGFYPVTSFAGSRYFDIELHGLSGHGAQPHNAIDAIVAASNLILQLQTVVSREIDPANPAVISIGRIEGGTIANVIADTVHLYGTMRALEPEVFDLMEESLKRLLRGLEMSMRVSYVLSFGEMMPPLVNDRDTLRTVLEAARAALGESKVIELKETSMAAEDFSLFASRMPAAHLRIGSRTPGTETKMIHRADYLPDEQCIEIAVQVLSEAAIALTGGAVE